MIKLAAFIFISSILVIFYHHAGYPLLLRYFSARRQEIEPGSGDKLNKFIFIIPMYNEATFVAEKIANLASLDYPADCFEVLLLDDGSTDKTSDIAQKAVAQFPNIKITIRTFTVNRGKVALFNQVIPDIPDDYILFFSDVSASLSTNTLQNANAWFNNPLVGAFSSKYQLKNQALIGEQYYWQYQNDIKTRESRLGTPIGYHGSGYAFRKILWKRLPANTINDDFIMPLQAIEQGYIGIYDTQSTATENESSSEHIDWNRRVRIAYGNIQQVFYLLPLLSPRQGIKAWMFFSGKVLRIAMPWLLLLLLASNLILAIYKPFFFLPVLLLQLVFYMTGFLGSLVSGKIPKVIAYFIKGHCASLAGWYYLFRYGKNCRWARAKTTKISNYVHPVVAVGKWILDKISALIGLSLLMCVFPFIAVIIKLSSPGRIFYRQIRVGKGTETQTRFFHLYKFRTMHVNPVDTNWTAANDPRIFAFGNFLRKTHLDELPQFYNILKGDMSLVGPRPERPWIYPNLVKNIPFYEERLFHVLPGLTGLAQVTCGYDYDIEDVRKKVAADHAYATYLTSPWVWIKMEAFILFKTIGTVFHRKGQ